MRSIKVLAFGGLVAMALSAAGCATVVPLATAPTNPAAEGSVKVSKGDNNNTVVLVKVAHLAPAAKITPNATTYVVWVRPLDGDTRPQNVGALQLDKDLAGELSTITPLTRFEVMVTPEPSTTVTVPTGTPQMTATIARE